jgi:alginate O-acetyltransferase complex protein AlgI
MVFHSHEFIFIFLPITLLGFFLVKKFFTYPWSLVWLAGASIVFYSSWISIYSLLLIASTLFNYLIGRLIEKYRFKEQATIYLLTFAIVTNLAILGYFKYTNFFIKNINIFIADPLPSLNIILPLGISFFTFYQIIYLVDVYSQQTIKHNFLHYFLFVTFFPYVTAGPIVLQKELLPQYTEKNNFKENLNLEGIIIGLSIFSIGLFKKLVLADGIAPYADLVFNAENSSCVSLTDAWLGGIAYSLQLYFDFSGYSDMSIGLGCMFGIKIPLNFNSPFKAVNIIDFWRRWHITMTRFFTTFVFSPIAISLMRISLEKDYASVLRFTLAVAVPIIFTFTVAGLWHGAGWTFVIFGLIHGVALATNYAWRELQLPKPLPLLGWAMTMGVVVIGLVVFRAESLMAAWAILQSMFGINYIAKETTTSNILNIYSVLPPLALLSGIVLLAPNVYELMRAWPVTIDPLEIDNTNYPKWMVWQPNIGWAIFCTILFLVAVFSIKEKTQFLYYKF